MKKRLERERLKIFTWNTAAYAAVVFIFAWMYASRFYYASPYAGTWDTVDFALALERFDLLAMQPHFPGYPYFILGGTFVHQWIDNPAKALSIFNVGISLLSNIPIYLLARRRLSPLMSLLLCLLVQGLSYMWVLTTQPMSEGTAIALLWWYLWSLQKSFENGRWTINILPLFFFSLLMGVRLSYVVFGLGLCFLWVEERRRNSNRVAVLKVSVYALIAAAFQFIWIAGLAYTEGSFRQFIQLALAFTDGHLSDWGGAVTTMDESLGIRLLHLCYNIGWVGFLCKSALSGICMVAALLVCLARKRRYGIRYFEIVLSVLWAVYLGYAFAAQNIDKPRHIAPLLGLGVFLLFMVMSGRPLKEHPLKGSTERRRQRLGRVSAIVLVLLFLAVQLMNGFKLAHKQAKEAPATYQLARHLEQRTDDFIVYTWEEDRVLHYLRADYGHQRIKTYDYFRNELNQLNKGKTILITNRVLNGFEAQGIRWTDKVNKVKEFRSDPLSDPVYHHVTIYEWLR